MDVRDRIRDLFEEKKVSYKKVSEDLGIHRLTLMSWSKDKYPKVNDLITLARYFKTPMSYFFDDDVYNNNQSIKGKQVAASFNGNIHINQQNDVKEIRQLKTLLSAKEEIIEEKERVIQLLMMQLENNKSVQIRDENTENEKNNN